MADFNQSYYKVMQIEGGYSNDPTDNGGETYKGIARKFWPDWAGWKIIDQIRFVHGKSLALTTEVITSFKTEYQALQPLVVQFYKDRFWNTYQGDSMPQELGDEMFDCAVNLGVGTAGKFLQRALSCLNRNDPSWYADLVDDGAVGPGTLKALKAYLSKDPVDLLVKIINVQQGAYYMEFMKKSPAQEKFARGWFTRVECRAMEPIIDENKVYAHLMEGWT